MTAPELEIIRRALDEDVGAGDLTSECFVPAGHRSTARIVAREEAVVAGIDAARAVFALADPSVEAGACVPEGRRVGPGATVLTAAGPTRALLTAERTALNLLQRLSGVATLTRLFVDAVSGTGAVILDTRKTTPGLRTLERAAVRAGGGTNHRFGLFDRVLAKDNHLAVTPHATGIAAAIRRARERRPDIVVEIEADTLDQVRMLASLGGVDVILLDNMDLAPLREAVRICRGTGIRLEASGGVRLDTVRAIAGTGVDFISVGALTHSARAIDFSMELEPGP